MNIELRQKNGLNVRKFTLTNDSVIVEIRKGLSKDRSEVKLNDIGDEMEYDKGSTLPGKIFLWFCILAILGLIIEYLVTLSLMNA